MTVTRYDALQFQSESPNAGTEHKERRKKPPERKQDKLWWHSSVAGLTGGSHSGWRRHTSRPHRFYCSGWCYICLIIYPIIFQTHSPLFSLPSTRPLTFIDAGRIRNRTSVWVGNRSSLLRSDDKRKQIPEGRPAGICFLDKGLTSEEAWIPTAVFMEALSVFTFIMPSKYIIKNPDGFSVSPTISSWQAQSL